MRIVVSHTVPGASRVEIKFCCKYIEYAIKHGFIDDEWSEGPGGIKLWASNEMLANYTWLSGPGEGEPTELPINFCPFCGAKIIWEGGLLGYGELLEKVKEFAEANDLILNLRTGPEYYLSNIMRFGRCPCDKTRLECPCPQALDDVEATGHCLCRLFWKDAATYEEQMGKSKEPPDQSGSLPVQP